MKIIELEIKNIRGVKELKLFPNKNNIVIWGINGSGKSAVVDAIDFLLTGRMTRLTGQGTGGITLKRHGAHIDCDDHSQAFVKATVCIKGFKDPIAIRRCIHNPDELDCPPEVKDLLSPIEEIALRGQHILTRREILKFITAEGNKRAEGIQGLLSLDDVENIRQALVKARNNLKNNCQATQQNVNNAQIEVNTTLGLSKYEESEILIQVNNCRKLLGSAAIDQLFSSKLKSSVSPPTVYKDHQDEEKVDITALERNIMLLQDVMGEVYQSKIKKLDGTLRALVSGIHEDALDLHSFQTQKLISEGINLIEATGNCPLCDKPWEPDQLKKYLEQKLTSAQFVNERLGQITEIAEQILKPVKSNISILSRVIEVTRLVGLVDDLKALENWEICLNKLKDLLENPLYKYHFPEYDQTMVMKLVAPEEIVQITNRIFKATKKKFPETTPEQSAWDTLTKLEVNMRVVEQARRELELAQLSFSKASILEAEFEKTRDEILGELYDEIKDRFVELYRELHHDDEGNFEARLCPSGAALDFEVDFYGRGSHPPHALHSEGHQDSMGVCLFLALSEKLTEGFIDLIILDDVVMSVDANHRRDLCNVLAKHFPKKQFLITTHDRTWAMQLKNNGVVKQEGLHEFFNWDIDTGPQVSDIVDMWDRIEKDLINNDVPSAAHKLRRGSEQFFAEVCHNLNASVPYQIDGRYELGDLLYGAMSQLKDLINKGKEAARSWHQGEDGDIKIMDEERKEVYTRLGEEQWAVNVNVHYNDWADFTKSDFEPVVSAYKNLFNIFSCKNCGSIIYITQEGKQINGVRCHCTKVNWNLIEKKK